jgi:hypothetical protein
MTAKWITAVYLFGTTGIRSRSSDIELVELTQIENSSNRSDFSVGPINNPREMDSLLMIACGTA